MSKPTGVLFFLILYQIDLYNVAMGENMDKRNKTRVEFHTTAEIVYDGHTITGPIGNLSMKGLFVQTTEKPAVKTPIDITIRLSGSSTNLSIQIKGEVIRVEDDGIAMEFKEMELDSFIHLRNIVFYADKELHEFLEFT